MSDIPTIPGASVELAIPTEPVDLHEQLVESHLTRARQLSQYSTAFDWISREVLPFAQTPGDLRSGFSEEVQSVIEDRRSSVPKKVAEALAFLTEYPASLPEQRRGQLAIGVDTNTGWTRVDSSIPDTTPALVKLTPTQVSILTALQDQVFKGRRSSSDDLRKILPVLAGESDEAITADFRSIQAKFECTGHGTPVTASGLFSFPDVTVNSDIGFSPPTDTILPDKPVYAFSHRASAGKPAKTISISSREAFEAIRILASEASFNGGTFNARQLRELLPGKLNRRVSSGGALFRLLAEVPETEKLFLSSQTVGKEKQKYDHIERMLVPDGVVWEPKEVSLTFLESNPDLVQDRTDNLILKGIFELVSSDRVDLVVPVDTEANGVIVSSESTGLVQTSPVALGTLAMLEAFSPSKDGLHQALDVLPAHPVVQTILANLRQNLEDVTIEPTSVVNLALDTSISSSPELERYIKYDRVRWEEVAAQVRPLIESAQALSNIQPDLAKKLSDQAAEQLAQTLASIEAEAIKAREFETMKEMVEVLGRLAHAGALDNLNDEELRDTLETVFAGEIALRGVLLSAMSKRLLQYAEQNELLRHYGDRPSRGNPYGRSFTDKEAFSKFEEHVKSVYGLTPRPGGIVGSFALGELENPFHIVMPFVN